MDISQVFYFTGTLFFIVFTIGVVVIAYEVSRVARAMRAAADRATDIVDNVKQVSTGMKFGLWALAAKLLGAMRGGEK